MKTLEATLPDGRTITRKTYREYILVVCVLNSAGQWQAHRWTTRKDLAKSAEREARGYGSKVETVAVLERVKQSSPRTLTARRTKKVVERCAKCKGQRSRHYELCQFCRESPASPGA